MANRRIDTPRLLLVILLCIGLLACNPLDAAFEAGAPKGNLLRNASFLQTTNRPIPDYWDLHHAAAITFRDLHDQYFVSDTVASPVAGTKTLVIANSEKNFHHAMLLPRMFFHRLPKGTYTFSVYAKADMENAGLLIHKGWGDEGKPVNKVLTKQWQRYSLTFDVGSSAQNPPQPIMHFPAKATYFIAAPQLEQGASATLFRLSPDDAPDTQASPSDRGRDMDLRAKVAKGRRDAAPVNAVISADDGPGRGAGSQHQVRVSSRRYLEVDNAPFFIIGMEVGGQDNLPDWYFDDLAAHGINTLFLGGVRDGKGAYDLTRIRSVLMKAEKHGFKVVLGRPLMGNRDPDWREKISAFRNLMEKLKSSPAIIAWEPVDEPAANTWQDRDLLEIYGSVKQTDPSRPVFMNWAYDGVPAVIGAHPRGTLQATDFYSMDYYPFAGQGSSMHDFTRYSVRALETARIFNKIPHAWIQLYGGMDAWREPSGDELNYMVYLNLMYGGMFSYWNTKSNSAANWSRVAEINRQAKALATSLFLNPEAREMRLPEYEGNFVYSVWKAGSTVYLIALHNGQGAEPMDFDLTGLIGPGSFQVRSMFENRKIAVSGRRIKELFLPYQSRVYVVSAGK